MDVAIQNIHNFIFWWRENFIHAKLTNKKNALTKAVDELMNSYTHIPFLSSEENNTLSNQFPQKR